MKIKVTTLYVDDQEKALRFYTEVLGFVKKTDFSQVATLGQRLFQRVGFHDLGIGAAMIERVNALPQALGVGVQSQIQAQGVSRSHRET